MNVSWNYEDETNKTVMTVVFGDQSEINSLHDALIDSAESLEELKAAVLKQTVDMPAEK